MREFMIELKKTYDRLVVYPERVILTDWLLCFMEKKALVSCRNYSFFHYIIVVVCPRA